MMRTEPPAEDVLAPRPPVGSSELHWELHLGRDKPTARWVVIGAALAAALVGFLALRSPLLGALGMAAVLGSTLELFVAQKYGLTAQGAYSRNGPSRSEVPWENVRRVVPDDRGVLVSPLARAGRLDAFRGVYLRFAGNREEVLAKIAELWQPDDERALG